MERLAVYYFKDSASYLLYGYIIQSIPCTYTIMEGDVLVERGPKGVLFIEGFRGILSKML